MHSSVVLWLSASTLLWACSSVGCSGEQVTTDPPQATGGGGGADAGVDSGGTGGTGGTAGTGGSGGSGGSGGFGGSGGSGGSPADVTQPPAPVTLRFLNGSGMTLYIDWSWADLPVPNLSRAGETEPLALSGGCTDACGPNCACMACDMAPPRVKVLAPGAIVEYVWDGTWFSFSECANQGCQCNEQRKAELGGYEAMVVGAMGVSGGDPLPSDPTVLENAWPDSSNGFCQAFGPFQLTPASGVFEFDFNSACAIP